MELYLLISKIAAVVMLLSFAPGVLSQVVRAAAHSHAWRYSSTDILLGACGALLLIHGLP